MFAQVCLLINKFIGFIPRINTANAGDSELCGTDAEDGRDSISSLAGIFRKCVLGKKNKILQNAHGIGGWRQDTQPQADTPYLRRQRKETPKRGVLVSG